MKISEVLKISMTFVGTIIGAGFASGREIALYFGGFNLFTPIVAGILLGIFAFVFAELGRISADGDILNLLFKKFAKPSRIFIKLANFITFVAMIAAAELILRNTFSVVGGGIFSALLSFSIVLKGNSGMKILNTILVPIIIFAVIGLSLKAPTVPLPPLFSILAPLTYVSMNLLTGGYLIGALTKSLTRRENFFIGIFVAIVTALLLSLIYRIVQVEKGAPMPVLAFATKLNLTFVSGVVIYLAILTTMVSSLKVSGGGKALQSSLSIALGFILSLLGFEILVDTFYPIIGYAGVGLSSIALLCYIKHTVSNFLQQKKRPQESLKPQQKSRFFLVRVSGKNKLFH